MNVFTKILANLKFRYFSNTKPMPAVYFSADEKIILNFFKYSNRAHKVTILLMNYFTTRF